MDWIRKRGVLKIGGSQDTQYIIGSPKAELVTATSETREPLPGKGLPPPFC